MHIHLRMHIDLHAHVHAPVHMHAHADAHSYAHPHADTPAWCPRRPCSTASLLRRIGPARHRETLRCTQAHKLVNYASAHAAAICTGWGSAPDGQFSHMPRWVHPAGRRGDYAPRVDGSPLATTGSMLHGASSIIAHIGAQQSAMACPACPHICWQWVAVLRQHAASLAATEAGSCPNTMCRPAAPAEKHVRQAKAGLRQRQSAAGKAGLGRQPHEKGVTPHCRSVPPGIRP